MSDLRKSGVGRVCHIVQSFYPRDPRIRRQAEALAEADYDVDVVCLRAEGESARDTINGVHVHRVPLTRRRGGAPRYVFEYLAFFVVASFVMAFRPRRYNVIHVSNMPDCLVFSAVLPRLAGTKVLLDEHDPMPELFAAKTGATDKSRLIRLLRWQQRASLRFADQVLTVSEAMRQRIEKIVETVRAEIVMNLPDKALFQAAFPRSDVRRNDSEFVLLYAGTVSGQYGLSIAVKALPGLIDRIPCLRLRIVGDGDDVATLRRVAEELGVADRLELVGDVPFSRIPEIMETSDIGISTLKRDAMTDLFFTNKGAEYVMMGLPAVIARTAAVEHYFPRDIVSMYEPDDVESFQNAILELYEKPQLYAEKSRAGIEFSATSNWATEKRKYVELIASMCG